MDFAKDIHSQGFPFNALIHILAGFNLLQIPAIRNMSSGGLLRKSIAHIGAIILILTDKSLLDVISSFA